MPEQEGETETTSEETPQTCGVPTALIRTGPMVRLQHRQKTKQNKTGSKNKTTEKEESNREKKKR